MSGTRVAGAVALAVGVVACGTSSGLSKSEATVIAQRLIREQARRDHRGCHGPLGQIVKLACHRDGPGWTCDFALSDGTGGSVSPSAHGLSPEITSIPC